ncbi:MAG: hypothetical protein IMF15_09075 [Proteobacteria bacterium]|nr:hypothetical protein [Pseudomonadota bacterium]
MAEDHYKLRDKSDADLHDWLCEQETGTAEYNSGILESMRRVAILEEALEKNEEPVRKRELIAATLAILSIILIIAAIVYSF